MSLHSWTIIIRQPGVFFAWNPLLNVSESDDFWCSLCPVEVPDKPILLINSTLSTSIVLAPSGPTENPQNGQVTSRRYELNLKI